MLFSGRIASETAGMTVLRLLLAAAMITASLALVSCSTPDPADTPGHDMRSELRRDQDCADKSWKAAHLGLWYSICRPNVAE